MLYLANRGAVFDSWIQRLKGPVNSSFLGTNSVCRVKPRAGDEPRFWQKRGQIVRCDDAQVSNAGGANARDQHLGALCKQECKLFYVIVNV